MLLAKPAHDPHVLAHQLDVVLGRQVLLDHRVQAST